MTFVQPLAKYPKLSSKSGQGHCITLTVGGILFQICFHFQSFILLCLLYSQLDMTHLDTLVTSVQLCPVLDVTQRTKRSHASRVRESLSHHVVSQSQINLTISPVLVRVYVLSDSYNE